MSEPTNEEKTLSALPRPATPPDPASDPRAYERLFAEHGDDVFRAAFRVTGRAEDAEDVTQNVFLRMMRKGGPKGLWENPGGYLHRAAINASLDLVRARKPGRDLALEEAPLAASADRRPSPAAEHAAEELKERVRGALAALSPKSAEIFALRYFEGYGNKDIARLVGSTENSVAVLLHRARKHVRDALAPATGEDR